MDFIIQFYLVLAIITAFHYIHIVRSHEYDNDINAQQGRSRGRPRKKVVNETEKFDGPRRSNAKDFFYYRNAQSIHNYMITLQHKYPSLVSIVNLGKSTEARPLAMMKISKSPSNTRIIMIDAGTHAREWISIALAVYIIYRLVEDNSTSALLAAVDWHIIPLVNPDGYEYSRNYDRMWRKNRRYDPTTTCYGVDLNRNYAYKWGETGTSKRPCDFETYGGAYAFSEPETRAVSDAMLLYKNRITLYISLHSYGQYLLYPWGWDNLNAIRWTKLNELGKLASDAVAKAGGYRFDIANAGSIAPGSGAADDYAYGVIRIPYVYTMELTKGYGFEFPEYLLSKALPQYFEAFKQFHQYIKSIHHKGARRIL